MEEEEATLSQLVRVELDIYQTILNTHRISLRRRKIHLQMNISSAEY